MADGNIFKLGNILYKKAYPVYNVIYPLYKTFSERKEIAFLKRKIKPGYKVIDIGANIGFYSRIMRELVGSKGHVYCFEPDKENYRHLENALNKFVNVSLFNKAVSDNEQSLKVYLSADLNVDHRTYPIDEYDKIVDIQGTSIDSFLVDKPSPQFIKIDIQGFEVTALKGMTKTLRAVPNLQMFMEFWPFGLRQAGTGVAGLVNELKQYNPDVFTIHDSTEQKIELDSLLSYSEWAWKQDLNLYIVFNSTSN
jgi:FkbM family methyltransferase